MRNEAISSEFIAAMIAAGMKPVEPVASRLGSTLIRFRCDGDGQGKRNGWAVLHLDGIPAGAFGNYRLGISERWRANCTALLTREERRELAKQYWEEKARREAAMLDQHRSTASACAARWERRTAVDPLHPYLVRHGISGEGLGLEGYRLLIPMLDAEGILWNVQTIDGEGVKRFAKGGRQRGLHLLIGVPGDTLAVAEGYGTGAVIRRATGLAVAIAFSAKNLTATALAMRSRFPAADIVIGADDDAHLLEHQHVKQNLGLEAARAAAQAVGGRVAVPPRKAA